MHGLLRLGKPGLLGQVLHQSALLRVPGSPRLREEMLQAGERNRPAKIKGWVGGMRLKSAFAQAVAMATADTRQALGPDTCRKRGEVFG